MSEDFDQDEGRFYTPYPRLRGGFEIYRAFEAGKIDAYSGDPSDECSCAGCRL